MLTVPDFTLGAMGVLGGVMVGGLVRRVPRGLLVRPVRLVCRGRSVMRGRRVLRDRRERLELRVFRVRSVQSVMRGLSAHLVLWVRKVRRVRLGASQGLSARRVLKGL